MAQKLKATDIRDLAAGLKSCDCLNAMPIADFVAAVIPPILKRGRVHETAVTVAGRVRPDNRDTPPAW
jgi:hypothetical protein